MSDNTGARFLESWLQGWASTFDCPEQMTVSLLRKDHLLQAMPTLRHASRDNFEIRKMWHSSCSFTTKWPLMKIPNRYCLRKVAFSIAIFIETQQAMRMNWDLFTAQDCNENPFHFADPSSNAPLPWPRLWNYISYHMMFNLDCSLEIHLVNICFKLFEST